MVRSNASPSKRSAALIAVGGSVLLNLCALALMIVLQPERGEAEHVVQAQALEMLVLNAEEPKPLQLTRIKPIAPIPESVAVHAPSEQAQAAREASRLSSRQAALQALQAPSADPAPSQSPSAPALHVSRADAADWRVERPSLTPTPASNDSADAPPQPESDVVEGAASNTPEAGDASGDLPGVPDGSGEAESGTSSGEGDAPALFVGARITRNVNPQDYLPLRIRGRFTGTSKVEITIDAQGKVISVQHLSSDVSEGYEDYAEDAATEYAEAITVISPARRGETGVRDVIVLEIVWEE